MTPIKTKNADSLFSIAVDDYSKRSSTILSAKREVASKAKDLYQLPEIKVPSTQVVNKKVLEA